MINRAENPDSRFSKYTGSESQIRIKNEKKIGEGNFGKVFDATVEIAGRERRFVLKRYADWATGSAQVALDNYQMLKEAGLKVFNTFRIDEDGKTILMTPGISDNEECVSANGDNRERYKIDEIQNFQDFLPRFFQQATKAAGDGISISADVYFFTYQKQKSSNINYFLGDLDRVFFVENKENLKRENLDEAKQGLLSFLRLVVANESNFNRYKEEIERKY